MGASRSTLRALLLVVVTGLVVALPFGWSPAFAVPTLLLDVSAPLSAEGAPVELHITTQLGGPWPGAKAVVNVRGPGAPSAGTGALPLASSYEQNLGDLRGQVDARISVPADKFPGVGGYEIFVDIVAGAQKRMTGSVWLGRVSSLPPTVELAMVLPVAAGVHRDPSGVFVDETIQQAVTPDAGSPGSLYALFTLADRYPKWRMTWAVEPLLLGQIGELSDGFMFRPSGGAETAVEKGTGVAAQATQALDTFRAVSRLESLQIIPMPYASPQMSLVAAKGWPDGFDQVQLGKTQVQSVLQLPAASGGMLSPGLDVTTESLSVFSSASVDYVLADTEVANDLTEKSADLSLPVRVRDQENGRLTLLFVSPELRAALAPPWDGGVFAAALADELTGGSRGPFIATPSDEYGWPPADFLREIGDMLGNAPWIQTRTLAEVLSAHPPDSRPVFLSRYGTQVEGFVADAYVKSLGDAQAKAGDFESATDSERAPLNKLRLLLMDAESRYWFVAGVDPKIANLGLAYVRTATDLVAAEFDKVDVAGDKSVIVMGRQGDVPVAVVNKTGYPIKLQLVLAGDGVSFDGGSVREVTLSPQENVFSFPARFVRGRAEVTVSLKSGNTKVDEGVVRVRSISAGSVIPWVAGVGVLLLVGVALLRRRRR